MLALVLCALLRSEAGPDTPGPLPGASAKESPSEALLREAKGLRYAQRWFEAAQVYRRFLTEYPKSSRIPEVRFWLAATLEQDQRWDEAAAAYTEFLTLHPDQRMLGQEAKLNRIRCWGIRQGQSPAAVPGLTAALGDAKREVQVAAALQLAKRKDKRAVESLQMGLALPAYADACSLALVSMGVKPDPSSTTSQVARFLVIRIQQAGKPETVTIRLAMTLARAVENYLSDAQLAQARAKGLELDNLTERASQMPKGSVLLSVDDGKSSVTVTVE